MLSERLREIRAARKWTQKQLSLATNVPEATISRIEKNHRDPSMRTLCKLATVLEVSTDYLLGLSENTNTKNPSAIAEMFTRLPESDRIVIRRVIMAMTQR